MRRTTTLVIKGEKRLEPKDKNTSVKIGEPMPIPLADDGAGNLHGSLKPDVDWSIDPCRVSGVGRFQGAACSKGEEE